MIRFICAAAAISASAIGSAQVPPVISQVEIIGEAIPACVLRANGKGQGTNMSFQASGRYAGEVRISQLVDPSTGIPRNASLQLQLPVVCNSPHKVVLRRANGNLVRSGTRGAGAAGPFRNELAYELSATWDGQDFRKQSDSAGDFVMDSAVGRAADLDLSIAIRGGGTPLVAGIYSDTITVQFQAAN